MNGEESESSARVRFFCLMRSARVHSWEEWKVQNCSLGLSRADICEFLSVELSCLVCLQYCEFISSLIHRFFLKINLLVITSSHASVYLLMKTQFCFLNDTIIYNTISETAKSPLCCLGRTQAKLVWQLLKAVLHPPHVTCTCLTPVLWDTWWAPVITPACDLHLSDSSSVGHMVSSRNYSCLWPAPVWLQFCGTHGEFP